MDTWSTGGLSLTSLALLGVASFFIAILGGIIGVALGVIRLPVMTLAGVDPLLAAGTNLLVTLIISWISAVPEFLSNRGVLRVALFLGAPGAGGAFAGGWFSEQIPLRIIFSIVGAFMLWAAVTMIVRGYWAVKNKEDEDDLEEEADPEVTPMQISREASLGFVIGSFSGVTGLALGVVRLPALIEILKINPKSAASTNLLITVFVSFAGFVAHLLVQHVNWPLAIVLATTSVPGALLGMAVRSRVASSYLRIIIGIVLIVITPFMVWQSFQAG